MNKSLIQLAVLLIVVMISQCNDEPILAKEPSQPHIILYFADDLGLFDTTFAGNSTIRTPNLDRLVAEGLYFQNAFAPASICTPSRSALYTGIYPVRNGAHPNHSHVKPGIQSLPHYLKPLGYRVVLIGKKHFGPDEQFPFDYQGNLNPDNIERVLEEHNHTEPLCLIIASNDPHWPHQKGDYSKDDVPVPPYMVDTPPTRQLISQYYADITHMDERVGQLYSAMQRHGYRENTALFFTSDHGAPLPYGKWTLYDSGLHVPFFVHWPGMAQAGSTSDALISFVDLLPTWIEMAGGAVPSHIDGKSFLNVIKDPQQSHHQVVFGTHTNQGIILGTPYPSRSIRDHRYHLIVNLNPDGIFENLFTKATAKQRKIYFDVWRSWKQLANQGDPHAQERVQTYRQRPAIEFFDTKEDPYELQNLANDPRHTERISRMQTELHQWMSAQDDAGLETEMAAKSALRKKHK